MPESKEEAETAEHITEHITEIIEDEALKSA